MRLITSLPDLTAIAAAPPIPSVWGYVRVSTAKQEDEGVSLDAQRAGIAAYCASHGLAEPVIVQEVASAGKPMLAIHLPGTDAKIEPEVCPRPLFSLLIALLMRCDNAHLVVWKMDRMSRVSSESEMFCDMLRRSEVTLHSTQAGESGDTTDPIASFTRQVLAAAAQYERQLITMRSLAGSRHKGGQGGWLGGGPSFGYIARDGDLVVHPVAAEQVRAVFHMRDRLMYSYSDIVKAMEARTGERWHRMRVSRVLKARDLYNGFYTDPATRTRHPRPDLRILPEGWGAEGLPPEKEETNEPGA